MLLQHSQNLERQEIAIYSKNAAQIQRDIQKCLESRFDSDLVSKLTEFLSVSVRTEGDDIYLFDQLKEYRFFELFYSKMLKSPVLHERLICLEMFQYLSGISERTYEFFLILKELDLFPDLIESCKRGVIPNSTYALNGAGVETLDCAFIFKDFSCCTNNKQIFGDLVKIIQQGGLGKTFFELLESSPVLSRVIICTFYNLSRSTESAKLLYDYFVDGEDCLFDKFLRIIRTREMMMAASKSTYETAIRVLLNFSWHKQIRPRLLQHSGYIELCSQICDSDEPGDEMFGCLGFAALANIATTPEVANELVHYQKGTNSRKMTFLLGFLHKLSHPNEHDPQTLVTKLEGVSGTFSNVLLLEDNRRFLFESTSIMCTLNLICEIAWSPMTNVLNPHTNGSRENTLDCCLRYYRDPSYFPLIQELEELQNAKLLCSYYEFVLSVLSVKCLKRLGRGSRFRYLPYELIVRVVKDSFPF